MRFSPGGETNSLVVSRAERSTGEAEAPNEASKSKSAEVWNIVEACKVAGVGRYGDHASLNRLLYLNPLSLIVSVYVPTAFRHR